MEKANIEWPYRCQIRRHNRPTRHSRRLSPCYLCLSLSCWPALFDVGCCKRAHTTSSNSSSSWMNFHTRQWRAYTPFIFRSSRLYLSTSIQPTKSTANKNYLQEMACHSIFGPSFFFFYFFMTCPTPLSMISNDQTVFYLQTPNNNIFFFGYVIWKRDGKTVCQPH